MTASDSSPNDGGSDQPEDRSSFGNPILLGALSIVAVIAFWAVYAYIMPLFYAPGISDGSRTPLANLLCLSPLLVGGLAVLSVLLIARSASRFHLQKQGRGCAVLLLVILLIAVPFIVYLGRWGEFVMHMYLNLV